MAASSQSLRVKSLSFPLTVLDAANVADLLDLVTRVDGVVAALVERDQPGLQVLVRSDHSALLVREELRTALFLSGGSPARA
ncbi:MAG: hypothetical protein QOE90_2687 [Thermoplasmata archaeon]|nr:hypothetical protein [Thermoplasmata archaeon]